MSKTVGAGLRHLAINTPASGAHFCAMHLKCGSVFTVSIIPLKTYCRINIEEKLILSIKPAKSVNIYPYS